MDIEASYSPSNGGTGRKTRKSMLLAALPDLSDEENDKNDAEKEDVKPKGSRLSGVSRRSSVGGRRLSGFGARRRSSMGLLTGKGEKRTAAEQQKLVEMYRMAIKMSSENKVSAKNAWNLNLIDTLDEVVEMEDESTVDATAKSERRRSRGGGRRGLSVNFQRASCALEAGVRIYSCRVDDTHTRSMRVLENLARGSGGRRGPADGGLDDDDGDGDGGEGEGAAGKKRRPVRAAAVATLEKNRANIDAPNVEAHAAVDPLFHKMSRAFDEGGARGMLLANLGVARGSRVMFDSGEGAEEEERPAGGGGGGGGGDWAAPVDCSGLAELVRQRQDQAAAAGERPGELCPGLGLLRRELGALVELDLEAALERPPRAAAADAGAGGGGGAEEEAVEGLADQLAAGLALGGPGGDDSLFQEDDFGDGGVDFGFDNDDFEDNNMVGTGPEDSYYEAPHRGGLRAAVARLSLMPGAGAGASYRQSVARPVAARLLEGVTGDQFIRDEYNFFDAVALGKNQWAGASHWKFAAQKSKLAGGAVAAALPEEDGGEEGEEEAGGGAGGGRGRRKKKKEAFAFDFLGGPPVTLADLELPQPPAKGKRAAADPTAQTAAALAKNAAAADRGELLLPQDAHVQARDLVRLFLRPSAYVSRARRGLLYSLPDPAGGGAGGAGGGGGGGFFGAGAGAQDLNGPEDDDDEGAGFDFDAGGDGFGEEDFHGDDTAAGAYQALFLNGGDDLVTADRRVEKIEINYARTAKKVDVRQLKKQLWKEINTTLGVERGGTAAEGADNSLAFAGSQTAFEGPALGEGAEFRATTTFRDMIAGCAAASAVQSEVTVPFYFICALHLANEKGLHFEAASEMDNFVIKAAAGSNPQ